MQSGTVKLWDAAKGFGFILTDDDQDLFVNVRDLDRTVTDKKLKAGQRVKFDIMSDMKGDRAIHVRLIK
ncbi:cold shock domain-containing protein [candidate division KSB1 bacterium]|nr:cold shock domain-containing protein [candidate division KSB1 bacterium]